MIQVILLLCVFFSSAQTTSYDGIYVSTGSRPRLYILSKGNFYKYNKKLDDSLPTGYYYDRDLVSTFSVENDKLICPDYDFGAYFVRDGSKVTAMEDRFVKTVKANSLKDIFAKNEWDAKPLLSELIHNHGLSEDDAKNIFMREDLWESISSADFGNKTKITIQELALNYIDGKFNKAEGVSGKNAYDGVFGFAQNGSSKISSILVVKNSRIAWIDVFWDTTGGTKNDLVLRPLSTRDSKGPIDIVDGKYSYSMNRFKGQFIIKEGQVTGVKDGTTQLIRYPTMEAMIKMNPAMDARELLSQLTGKYGMDAEVVKELITGKPLIEFFTYDRLDQRQTLAEMLSQFK